MSILTLRPATPLLAFLDRERTVAGPGYNRWLVPPAALAIHLAIGEVYAFSVFNLPLTHVVGITASAPEDWKLSTLGWIFSIAIVFLLGAALYALTPQAGKLGSVVLFVLGYAVIISMYGGGFATIPAYLRDQFGTAQVGAIHGRLLTAWSAAGVAGPVLVNYLREYQIEHGVARADAYTITMYIMAGLLLVGLVCNSLVRQQRRRDLIAQT